MIRGWTEAEIAERHDVSQPTISRDWKLAEQAIAKSLITDVKRVQQLKLAQYRAIYKECWEAWEKSKLDAEQTVSENYPETECPVCGGTGKNMRQKPCRSCDGTGTKASTAGKVVHTKKGQCGDSEYLRTMLACMKAEREMLNLDPELKVNISQQVNWDVLARGIPTGQVPDVIEAEMARALGYTPTPTDDEILQPTDTRKEASYEQVHDAEPL